MKVNMTQGELLGVMQAAHDCSQCYSARHPGPPKHRGEASKVLEMVWIQAAS